MFKKILLVSILTLAAPAINSAAFFNFGFGFGGCAEPSIGFGVSIPFDECNHGPNFGFGFSMPIATPVRHVQHVVYQPAPVVYQEVVQVPAQPARVIRTVHIHRPLLDNKKLGYWKIHNATDSIVKAINCDGEFVNIAPHESARLSHANGFDLKVRFKGSEKYVAYLQPEKHNLTVLFNDGIIVE